MTAAAKPPRRPRKPGSGAILRAAREAAGLTQRALAERLADEHQAAASWIVSLSRYESGAQVPEPRVVERIIAALAMPPAEAVRVAVAHGLRAEVVGEWVSVYGVEAVAGELERRAGMLRDTARRLGLRDSELSAVEMGRA